MNEKMIVIYYKFSIIIRNNKNSIADINSVIIIIKINKIINVNLFFFQWFKNPSS
jgi:hypothetical protein